AASSPCLPTPAGGDTVPGVTAMIAGVPKEAVPGERRVALVPDLVPKLVTAGLDVIVQTDAGRAAGFPDEAFRDKGARIQSDVLGTADILLRVQPPTAAE